MAFFHSPNIVTDGLVLCYDAADKTSYSGSIHGGVLSTWTDLGGSNNGTLNNGPTFDTGSGGSIKFDGSDDNVQVSAATTIRDLFDDGGTWSAWINPLSDGENNQGRIMDKSSEGQLRFQGESGGNLEMFFYIGFSGDDGHWSTTSAVVSVGEWSHVALTYNNGATGNNPKFYHNGVEITAVTEDQAPTGTRVSESNNLFIMGNSATPSRALDGNLAQVILYNRILGPEEVFRNYNAHRGRFGV
jgi:hypothetical protein